MFLTAAQDRGIDLAASWMVGDSESDVLAGRNAGCRTIRIGSPDTDCSTAADELAKSLVQAVNVILAAESLDTSRDSSKSSNVSLASTSN
jgi:D-glycero-D-manno-heptose 1,7-bisphosphate phosphatase